MKNIFKEAHKMTREIVERYGVDYHMQFGLCLSYLLSIEEVERVQKVENVNDFNKKEQQIVLASGRLKPWVAVICDFDEKYEFERRFLKEDEIFQHFFCYNLEEGYIYNWSEGRDQSFGIVENGALFEISKGDVRNLLSK